MDPATLKVVGVVAGIGGVALGVLLILFREVIRKNIFRTLSQEHGYRLLRLIVVLTWSVALAGLLAWLYVNVNANAGRTETKDLAISGLVTDTDNNALKDADIVVLRANHHTDNPARTDGHGMFLVNITSSQDSEVALRVEKAGFKTLTQPVKVPSYGLLLALQAAGAPPATPPVTPRNPNVRNPPTGSRNKPVEAMVAAEPKHTVLQTPNAMKGPDARREPTDERCPEVTVMDFSRYPPESKIERRCLP
jgi:hypothetical protein